MDKKKEKQSVLQLLFGFMDRANGDHVGAYAAQAAYFLIMSFIPFILFLTTIIRYTPLTYNMVSETIRAFAPQYTEFCAYHCIRSIWQKHGGSSDFCYHGIVVSRKSHAIPYERTE